MRRWIFLITAILFEVTASLSLKGTITVPALVVVVVAGYLAAFVSLYLSLRTGMPLGVGYGLWAAFGVALTAILSMLVFDEPLTLTMGIGIVVIMVGVLLVELGSQAAQREATT